MHVAVVPLPLRVHEAGENEPAPLGVVEKLTVPVGVTGRVLVSVTVAVHVVAMLTGSVDGEQETVVEVPRKMITVVDAELPVW